MTISKYRGITYPFFAIKRVPYSIRYDKNQIVIQKYKDNSECIVDDRRLPGDYFARLVQLDRKIFDYTCRDLEDLLNCKAKWGLDSTAKIFDLSAPEKHRKEIRKVQRVKNNFIFVDKISYPFKIDVVTPLEQKHLEDLYVEVIMIENEWYLHKFTREEWDSWIAKMRTKL